MADSAKKKEAPVKIVMTGGRWFMFGTAAVAIFIAYAAYSIHKSNSAGLAAKASLNAQTDRINNTAGSTHSSPMYNQQVNDMNHLQANQALQNGQSFVPTPILAPAAQPPKPQPPAPPRANYQPANQNQQPPEWHRPNVDQAVTNEISQIASVISTSQQPSVGSLVLTAPAGSAEEAKAASMASASAATVASVSSNKPKVVLPAGSLIYGVFNVRMESDVPGPVLGELVQGKWNGYKVLGKFKNIDGSNLLSIHMTALVDKAGNNYPIDAYAISPETTLPAMATDVDRHILSRVGSFAGAAFLAGLQGYGAAVANAGATTSNTLTGSTTTYPLLTGTQLMYIAAGSAAQNLQAPEQALQRMIVQPNTITVKEGTPFVLLTVGGAESTSQADTTASAKPASELMPTQPQQPVQQGYVPQQMPFSRAAVQPAYPAYR